MAKGRKKRAAKRDAKKKATGGGASKKASKKSAHKERQEAKKRERAARKAARRERYKGKYMTGRKKLGEQLKAMGLRVCHVLPDGNCLFRSLSDQLSGNQSQHATYRKRITDHMHANREEFECFVEDDEPWESYIADMRKNRSWGGNLELKACLEIWGVNVVIHQVDAPRMVMANIFTGKGGHTIHLAYSGGDHYDSVRHGSDGCNGLPLRVGLDLQLQQGGGQSKKSGWAAPAKGASKGSSMTANEKVVMQSTRCPSLEHVRDVLFRAHLSVEVAVAMLQSELSDAYGSWPVALRRAEQSAGAAASHGAAAAATAGDSATDMGEDEQLMIALAMSAQEAETRQAAELAAARGPPPEVYEDVCFSKNAHFWFPEHLAATCSRARPAADLLWETWPASPPPVPCVVPPPAPRPPTPEPKPEPKAIPRNKPCPCGSRKKYKRCCGAARVEAPKKREAAAPNHASLSNKERKALARKQKEQQHLEEARRKADPKPKQPIDLGMIGI